MGRAGWFDEVMRFYDRFLKGIKPTVEDPPFAVQTNDGKWRAEAQWPPTDSLRYTSALLPGSYTDHGQSYATAPRRPDATSGVWTISQPLPYDVHLSGSGRSVVDVTTTLPNANLVVDVYDLDADGTGPLDHPPGAPDPHASGSDPARPVVGGLEAPAGHRIGVRVTDNNQDFWLLAAPTLQTVTVNGGTVTLPFLRYQRTQTIQGDPGMQLQGYLARDRDGPAGDDRSSQSDAFTLPPRQKGDTGGGVISAGPAQPPVQARSPPRRRAAASASTA